MITKVVDKLVDILFMQCSTRPSAMFMSIDFACSKDLVSVDRRFLATCSNDSMITVTFAASLKAKFLIVNLACSVAVAMVT